MTFDIGLHEACVRVGVRYVITKFSRMDSLPNFLTHGAPQARASLTRRHECQNCIPCLTIGISLVCRLQFFSFSIEEEEIPEAITEQLF